MPQGGTFNCDFRFSLIFVSHAESIDGSKDSIPIAVKLGSAVSPHPPQPPAATVNGLIERAPSTVLSFTSSPKRASD